MCSSLRPADVYYHEAREIKRNGSEQASCCICTVVSRFKLTAFYSQTIIAAGGELVALSVLATRLLNHSLTLSSAYVPDNATSTVVRLIQLCYRACDMYILKRFESASWLYEENEEPTNAWFPALCFHASFSISVSVNRLRNRVHTAIL